MLLAFLFAACSDAVDNDAYSSASDEFLSYQFKDLLKPLQVFGVRLVVCLGTTAVIDGSAIRWAEYEYMDTVIS